MVARLAKGPVERDWTDKTLVLDIENADGEVFHFEIIPNEEDDLPTRPSGTPNTKDKTIVNMTIPLL